MATVGEVKAQLAEANMMAGEAYAAIQEAKEAIQGALASIQDAEGKIAAAHDRMEEAKNLAGAAFDGSGHDLAGQAFAHFQEAQQVAQEVYGTAQNVVEVHVRALIFRLENEAQDRIMAGQNASEMYIGSM